MNCPSKLRSFKTTMIWLPSGAGSVHRLISQPFISYLKHWEKRVNVKLVRKSNGEGGWSDGLDHYSYCKPKVTAKRQSNLITNNCKAVGFSTSRWHLLWCVFREVMERLETLNIYMIDKGRIVNTSPFPFITCSKSYLAVILSSG